MTSAINGTAASARNSSTRRVVAVMRSPARAARGPLGLERHPEYDCEDEKQAHRRRHVPDSHPGALQSPGQQRKEPDRGQSGTHDGEWQRRERE